MKYNIKYDPLFTLSVIETDKDLLSIFQEEVNRPISELKQDVSNGVLDAKVKKATKTFFNNLIITQSYLANKYAEVSGSTNNVSVGQTSPKKVKKNLPRRYGKVEINKDIVKQGGVPTNCQITALEVNDLKNIYVKLNTRMINDMLSDEKTLTNEDYRVIKSTIHILKNKLKHILKK